MINSSVCSNFSQTSPAESFSAEDRREKCPRCSFSNLVNDFSGFCNHCLLYMRPSGEQKVQAEQKIATNDWKQIGKVLKFEMCAQPYFLQRHAVDGKLRSTEMEYDQLKSFLKVQIGPNPSVNALSRLLGRGDKYAQIMFASDDDDPPEVYCIPRLIDAARHLHNKSSPFQVIFRMDYSWDDDIEPGDIQSGILCRSRNYCNRTPISNRFTMSLKLYLNPVEVAKCGGILVTDSGGIWGDESQVLCAFLGGHSMAASISGLGEHPMKSIVSYEDRLLSSIPAVDAGSYSDTVCTLARLLEGVVREIIRLGYRPLGFGLEDQLRRIRPRTLGSSTESNSSSTSRSLIVHRGVIYSDEDNDEYNSGLRSISNLLYRNRLHIPTSVQCNRNYMLRNSLSALITDLENLGHPSCTVGVNSTMTAVTGLTVSLRKYQQQTLAWALQQETSEHGILGHITAPVLDSSGTPTGIWYSPITGEFRDSAPKDVRGGFICDDVGMGKTVVVLALILANPAPNVYSEGADEHWGQQRDSSPLLSYDDSKSIPTHLSGRKRSISSNESDEEENSFRTQSKFSYPSSSTNKGKNFIHSTSLESPIYQKPIIYSGATLVICPVSLVGQWHSEVRDKLIRSDLIIIGYHGHDRERDICILANSDIIITTYETISADYRKKLKIKYKKRNSNMTTLANINWHRIILDESHKVKGQSVMNDAVSELVSKRRWCITGTPIQTKMADFAGQFRFLGIPIIGHMKYWYDMISKPHTKFNRDLLLAGVDPDIGFASVMAVLRRTVIRHSKSMRYYKGNELLLQLPNRYDILYLIPLSISEKDIYLKLEKVLIKKYKLILRQGIQAIRRNTIQLLSLVKDLQIVCAGGLLPNTFAELLACANGDMDRNAVFGECCICLDLMDEPLQTPCAHIFCADCIYGTINNLGEGRAPCPLCRRPLSSSQLKAPSPPAPAISTSDPGSSQSSSMTGIVAAKDSIFCGDEADDDYVPEEEYRCRGRGSGGNILKTVCASVSTTSVPSTTMLSKLESLVRMLRSIIHKDSQAKILVFSQFSQTLVWLQEMLPQKGFQFRTLSGSMTIQQRKKSVEDFHKDPSTTIFLLSMRSGAVGVNLTQANHIFVMEPCLNRALEDQAIGRVHRIGQQRDVHIYRLACRDTIEERVLGLQLLCGRAAITPESNVNGIRRTGGAANQMDVLLASYSSEHASHNSGGNMLGGSDLSYWLDSNQMRYSGDYPHFGRFGVGSSVIGADRTDIGKRQYEILFGLEPLPLAAMRTLEAACGAVNGDLLAPDLSSEHLHSVSSVSDSSSSSSSSSMDWSAEAVVAASVSGLSTSDMNPCSSTSKKVPRASSAGGPVNISTSDDTAEVPIKRPRRSSATRGEAFIRKFVLEEQRQEDSGAED